MKNTISEVIIKKNREGRGEIISHLKAYSIGQ
jgi:hypothetical protein